MVGNEVELVRRCLVKDEPSLRAFIQNYQQLIFGLCFRMLGHRQDAEDVTQDVFLRVFRSLDRWDQTRPLKPWLMTIAANRCRTALQQRSRRPLHTEFIPELAQTAHREETIDLAEELQLALETLREDQRICFVLFYQQELGCAEIAEVMECPEGTVKIWLHRARHELADHLRRRGILPEVRYELHNVRE